jgi:hypothetical protein
MSYRALGYVKVNRQARHDHWSRLYREARIRRLLSTGLLCVVGLIGVFVCVELILRGH